MSLEVRIWIVEYWDCTCDLKDSDLQQEPTHHSGLVRASYIFACPKYMPQSKSVWQAPTLSILCSPAQSRRSQCALPIKFTISREETITTGVGTLPYYSRCPQSSERPLPSSMHVNQYTNSTVLLPLTKLGMASTPLLGAANSYNHNSTLPGTPSMVFSVTYTCLAKGPKTRYVEREGERERVPRP